MADAERTSVLLREHRVERMRHTLVYSIICLYQRSSKHHIVNENRQLVTCNSL